jgi:hypothetical protein
MSVNAVSRRTALSDNTRDYYITAGLNLVRIIRYAVRQIHMDSGSSKAALKVNSISVRRRISVLCAEWSWSHVEWVPCHCVMARPLHAEGGSVC